MKIRQRSVCDNCRKRKLGCDGVRPGCTQCRLSRQTCSGYPDTWTFVPPNNPVLRDIQPKSKSSKPRGLVGPGSKELVGAHISDYVARITQCYMPYEEQHRSQNGLADSQPRICGAWVEVIPEISNTRRSNAVLETAVRAFALSITQNRPDISAARLRASHAYCHAIESLRGNFDLSGGQFRADLAASIMCLGLTELMFPEHPSGFTPHIRGVGGLFQSQGPRAFQSGVAHKLFAGFLPVLTIDTFLSRNPTFLAATEWQREPFALSPPSPMQKLLGVAAVIPSLLYNVDHWYNKLSERSSFQAQELIASFVNALDRLTKLEDELAKQGHRPCPQSPASGYHPEKLGHPGRILWFPNITAANVMIHLWSFMVVCMTEIRNLARSLSLQVLENLKLPDELHPAQLDDRAIELSILTSQSMEFCLQDCMALYGPASTLYPLRIAHQTLKASTQHRESVAYVEWIVERLVAKGLRAVPHIVFRV